MMIFWQPRFANPMTLPPPSPPPPTKSPITLIVTDYITGLICDNCTVN